MSNPVILSYAAPDPALYAALQNVSSGKALVLKGSSPYVPIPTGPLTNGNFERFVSISSTDNISTATFTITGYRLGSNVATTTTITGINNSTVDSTVPFQTILSITTDTNVTNVTAGSAPGANFNWQTMNTFCPYAQYSVQTIVGAEGGGATIDYTVNITIDNIQQAPTSIIAEPLSAGFTNATTSQFASFTIPATGIQLVVNAVGTTGKSLKFIFLQQGMRS